MELLKDYDCTIEYHLGKANIVADALSWKTVEYSAGIVCYDMGNLVALKKMKVVLDVERDHLLANFQVRPSLRDQIQSVQIEDLYLKKMREKVEVGTNS